MSWKAADLRLVSEGTRLLNIDFPSVDGYGSQFKVESMMSFILSITEVCGGTITWREIDRLVR